MNFQPLQLSKTYHRKTKSWQSSSYCAYNRNKVKQWFKLCETIDRRNQPFVERVYINNKHKKRIKVMLPTLPYNLSPRNKSLGQILLTPLKLRCSIKSLSLIHI